MKRLFALAAALLLLTVDAHGTAPLEIRTDYHDNVAMVADSVELFPVDRNALRLVAEARCSLPGAREPIGRSARMWGIVWGSYPERYYRVTITRNTLGMDTPAMDVELDLCSHGQVVAPVNSITLTSGTDMLPSAENSLQIEADLISGRTLVFVGDRALTPVVSETLDYAAAELREWGIYSRGPLAVATALTEIGTDATERYATPWTREMLERRFEATGDALEGFWEYLDRDNDDSLARIGGRYEIALVRNGEGYDLIYMSGAEVNCDDWKEGMWRGELIPTPFIDHYDLRWVDASFEPIDTDISADVSQGAILTLRFPLYSTTLRFCRAPLKDGAHEDVDEDF